MNPDYAQTPRHLASAVHRFAALLLCVAVGASAAPDALPPESVYHLGVTLTDQDGANASFAVQRGHVRIVSMFYASCPYVCPMTFETIKRTEAVLGENQRARLRVTLVSLDPERDTPAVLKQTAAKRKIDTTRWTLAQTEAGDVRKLAAVLGIQYRQLENREFNHSSTLILLDADGRVLARSSRIGEPDPEFIAAVRAALGA